MSHALCCTQGELFTLCMPQVWKRGLTCFWQTSVYSLRLFRVTRDTQITWPPRWGENAGFFPWKQIENLEGLVMGFTHHHKLTDSYLPDLSAWYLRGNKKRQSCKKNKEKRKNCQNPPNKAFGGWASPLGRCGFQMVALGINHFPWSQKKMKINNNNFFKKLLLRGCILKNRGHGAEVW